MSKGKGRVFKGYVLETMIERQLMYLATEAVNGRKDESATEKVDLEQ